MITYPVTCDKQSVADRALIVREPLFDVTGDARMQVALARMLTTPTTPTTRGSQQRQRDEQHPTEAWRNESAAVNTGKVGYDNG